MASAGCARILAKFGLVVAGLMVLRAIAGAMPEVEPTPFGRESTPAYRAAAALAPTTATTAPTALPQTPTTWAPAASPTITPSPTAPAFAAAFLRDVTIPDGTILAPGSAFVKTWALRNVGGAPWNETVTLRHVEGPALAPDAVQTVAAAAPGAYVEIAVAMAAPATPGEYRSVWQLCAGEAPFGPRITVVIVVAAAEPLPAATAVSLAAPAAAVAAPVVSDSRAGAPAAPRTCCKVCTTGKACGDSCIARNKTCHKGPGCACDG